MPPDDLGPLRAALVAAGRRLGSRGLIAAAEGNLSVRLPGARLLITPTGLRKDELVPADLVVVPLDRASPGWSAAGPRPSSDVAIHRAIYRARPDVVAVGHAHLPAAMALSLADEVPDPAALPETALLLPRLPYVPYGAMGSEELAGRIAAAFATAEGPLPGAVILERHGAVAVGSGDVSAGAAAAASAGAAEDASGGAATAAIATAVNRLELVDVLCRVWRDALLLRATAGRSSRIGPPTRTGRHRLASPHRDRGQREEA
ncbi:MAG: class II aldolase/adducin family protein [Chloroflexi bacterium]|nr:class II aldolase/adducin family protein [Chloroflexota bacterium]